MDDQSTSLSATRKTRARYTVPEKSKYGSNPNRIFIMQS